MATVNATLTFSLPEDIDTDRLDVYTSATESGTYVIATQNDYEYGRTTLETTLSDSQWYKIQFVNTSGNDGPYSDPVYGGTYTAASPFLAVSTTTDGANYASSQDVYDYSGLTTEDIAQSRVSAALRRSRAVIDYRTSEMGLERFDSFDGETARRKYNASLRILKEAEINMALGNIYQNLSDDRIIANSRENVTSSPNAISIGDTSISGDDIADRSESVLFLATLSARYFLIGEQLLSSLDTNSVRLISNDLSTRIPRFNYPFNGWS